MGNLARQYRTPQAPPDPKVKPKAAAEPAAKVSPASRLLAAANEARSIAKGETKPASVVGTENGTVIPVPKRGRPPKPKQEPWVAAGVSRRTWFRQQKAASANPLRSTPKTT